MQMTTQVRGPDGSITAEVYLSRIDQTIDEFLSLYADDEEERISPETFNTMLHYIYTKEFQALDPVSKRQRNNLDYDDLDLLNALFDKFVLICGRFKVCPSLLGFCTMIGCSKETLYGWKNERMRGKSPEYARTIKNWLSICESALAVRAVQSNSIGAIFALKANYSWRETSPVPPEEITQLHHVSAEEIARKYGMDVRSLPDSQEDLDRLDVKLRHADAVLPQRPDFLTEGAD